MYGIDLRDFLSEEEIEEATAERELTEEDAEFWNELR